ncbi:hypothetical protein OIU91_28485 [Streptomyces sp. NBC_01456]|uniref:hypothetical protein n=1 Tax=unclassified Streptomyces TaxID=2593676 RepID=UPI002E370A67|nr:MULTISPECIES: hypothetical protein [unclassified Streptomyces]
MSDAEQRQIADACAAVIAGAIEEVVAEFPDATPEAQARHAVRALMAQGWHITAEPLCARLGASPGPTHTTARAPLRPLCGPRSAEKGITQ